MKKDDAMTAEEFVAQMNSDPAMVARRNAQEQQHARRQREVQEITRPILDDFAEAGYPASSIDEVVRRYAPLPKPVVATLLRWLPLVEDPAVQEQLVRTLGGTRVRFDGTVLTDLFENTDSLPLRWAIANTIAEARPQGVSDWVVDALRERSYGDARQMLPLAAARLLSPEDANPLLLELLDEMPGHAALGLAVSGTERELPALESKCERVKGWPQREIKKAIGAINKRGGSQGAHV